MWHIESVLICKESQLLQSALCAFLGFYCWIVFVFNHTNSVVHRISSFLQGEPIASCKVHFVHSLAFILRLCWDEWNKVHPGHLFDLLDCWLQHDSILHAMRCIALQIVLQSMLCYTIYWMQYIVYCCIMQYIVLQIVLELCCPSLQCSAFSEWPEDKANPENWRWPPTSFNAYHISPHTTYHHTEHFAQDHRIRPDQ